jgi:DNA-binding Lrp family transcriptional regulator
MSRIKFKLRIDPKKETAYYLFYWNIQKHIGKVCQRANKATGEIVLPHHLHAFVAIFVEAPTMDDVVQALSKIDNVEELYEVTGEFDLVVLISASNIEQFREIMKTRVLTIKGVKSTVSSIVLAAHKGPKCQD